MKKSLCSITQLVEEGVTPHYSFEITVFLIPSSSYVVFVYCANHYPTGKYYVLIIAFER